jgi:Rrf2 family iron-sulfur cluster assembly transcriptional regulator
MKISTKSRYAVSAMLSLAMHRSKGPVTLAYLCEKQNISLAYLEQLFAKLREHGLVRGVRGPGGGYYLAHQPDKISIGEIMYAVDGRINDKLEVSPEDGATAQHCTSRVLWDDLSTQIFKFLSGISLEDIIRQGAERGSAREIDDIKSALADLTDQAA